MSEKRFSVRLRSECDGVVYSFFDGDKLLDVDMIVDLLNEQQSTITHLEKVNGKNFAKRRLLERDNLVLRNENEQLKVLLKEAEEEIDRLKKSNQGFMEALVNNESENEDNQETEVRECQFCGEFRTEYHEYEDYSWSAEDYCNAGHDLEDTNPNQCKDYWDNQD